MTTNRIEALSDGIFAIAMTLLVIEIHVPVVETANPGTLADGLRVLGPHVGAYVISFLILGTLWIGHHNHFVHIREADRHLLRIDIGFLCAIAFLPFSTALLAAYWNQALAGAAYGANLVLAGSLLWLHWVYATRGRRLTSPDLGEDAVRSARRRIEVGLITYLAATVLAFLWLPVSLVLLTITPIFYMLSSRGDRHLKHEQRGRPTTACS